MATYNLNPVSGSAIGTGDNDIFNMPASVPPASWSNFVLRGGDGTDALHFITSDTYDLTKFGEFSSIEKLAFIDSGAEVILSSQNLAGIGEISGGNYQGRLYLGGAALQTFDLRGKTLSGNYIFKTGYGAAQYSDIVLSDKSQLLAYDGNLMSFEVTAGIRVKLMGGSFTDAEKAVLKRKGVTYIWDDNASGAGNAAPVMSGLQGDSVQAKGLAVVALDAGANATISDNDAVRKITVTVEGGNANDKLNLANTVLDLPNGISEGGRIRDVGAVKAFAHLQNVTNSSFEIYSNGEATPAHVNKVVQSLVYYNTSTSGTNVRQVNITAYDAADKASGTSTVTVTHTGGITAPDNGGTTPGDGGSNVIKGSAKADVIYGGVGDDTISGGGGKDTLRGDAGKDVFVFDTRASKSNVDTIKSYKVREDSIWLDNAVFTKLGKGTLEKPQKLAGKAFWTGDKAHDSSDRIIYNKQNGKVYYDQDGTGSKAAVQIAKLDKNLKMAAGEFFVI